MRVGDRVTIRRWGHWHLGSIVEVRSGYFLARWDDGVVGAAPKHVERVDSRGYLVIERPHQSGAEV